MLCPGKRVYRRTSAGIDCALSCASKGYHRAAWWAREDLNLGPLLWKTSRSMMMISWELLEKQGLDLVIAGTFCLASSVTIGRLHSFCTC